MHCIDFHFDNSLAEVSRVPPSSRPETVLALLRWEFEADGVTLRWVPRIDQQDAWVTFPPLPAALLTGNKAGFALGVLRCDNRLAAVLAECGMTVANPSLDIAARHLQKRAARGYSERGSVAGRGDFVPLTQLF